MEISDAVEKELKATGGVLFGEETLVSRGSYNGNNFLAKNSSSEQPDERGYWPVERWILSLVEAQNPRKLKDEGLTRVQGQDFTFLDAVNACEELLLGKYRRMWPLLKVLDIGGEAVKKCKLLLAWKLGERIDHDNLKAMREDNQLRGLRNTEEFLDRCIDWEMNSDQNSQRRFQKTFIVENRKDCDRVFSTIMDAYRGSPDFWL
ncbi:unnamed protein product [Oikopleura dioica]|uniref:Uncharacterized protein n=1 Tax=Oikopleura dioica TaxID=34765 RepID=E4XWH3_OIKDI|nr:unnamed protein product [Oikopleura dioica]